VNRGGNAPDIPAGYRLWRFGDGDDSIPKPRLHPDAYYGLVGDFLQAVEGETEADPAFIGLMLMTKLGTVMGRHVSIRIGEHVHHCNLYELFVGETSTCKGIADDLTDKFMTQVDPLFDFRHMEGSFGSGQALLDSIRNRTPREREDNEPVREKRKCADDPEFATTVKLMNGKESVLGPFIRRGYDYKPITHKTIKHGRQRSTGHHVSFLAGITPDEMEDCVQGVDISNGMLNRFGINYGEMVAPLAFGGHIDWDGEVKEIVEAAKKALKAVKPKQRTYPDDDDLSAGKDGPSKEEEREGDDEDEQDPDLIEETDSHSEGILCYTIGIHGRGDGSDASRLWKPWYDRVRPAGTGSVPVLTKRQHVHVARRVNIISALDMAETVTGGAMRASMAWERHSLDSIEYLLGQRISGRGADLLEAIRAQDSRGLSGTDQQKVFSNNLTREEMQRLRDDLERRHLIVTVEVPTKGRTSKASLAIWPE
jgi:hypothetical protein